MNELSHRAATVMEEPEGGQNPARAEPPRPGIITKQRLRRFLPKITRPMMSGNESFENISKVPPDLVPCSHGADGGGLVQRVRHSESPRTGHALTAFPIGFARHLRTWAPRERTEPSAIPRLCTRGDCLSPLGMTRRSTRPCEHSRTNCRKRTEKPEDFTISAERWHATGSTKEPFPDQGRTIGGQSGKKSTT